METFDGPYDLLLTLTTERKVDISAISLGAVTDEFITRFNNESIAPDQVADFVVVAATLLLCKLNELLPELAAEDEEEINELADRLRIYQLYRQQAATWRERMGEVRLLPGPEQLAVDPAAPALPDVTGQDVARAFSQAKAKLPQPVNKQRHLRPTGRSLKECLGVLRERVARVEQLTFGEAVTGEDRQTQAVSFLALLQLSREQEVRLEQEASFAPIVFKLSKLKAIS